MLSAEWIKGDKNGERPVRECMQKFKRSDYGLLLGRKSGKRGGWLKTKFQRKQDRKKCVSRLDMGDEETRRTWEGPHALGLG